MLIERSTLVRFVNELCHFPTVICQYTLSRGKLLVVDDVVITHTAENFPHPRVDTTPERP